ncbi:MAG: TAT-variant-translocated molybdopterin oxidoreductase [Pirellulaceae bacterium]|nr:TAT-variant-translocated molybdopterin oxidoreductase [Pirellulaceae bacterium]
MWRSLAELDDAPQFRAFLEAEFPEALDATSVDRRRWLQIMGASFALSAVAGCEAQRKEILPFARRPEGRVPGRPDRYATAMDLSGSAVGLLVTCMDGRPLKVEGNPLHPQSLGASHALAQAAILELYDPDRSQYPVERTAQGAIVHAGDGQQDPWARFDEFMRAQMTSAHERRGASVYVLSEASSSPTLARLRDAWLAQLPESRWVEYDPLTDDNALAGTQLAFGKPLTTQLVLEQARVIVCIDADVLADHPAALQHTRAFAQGREIVDGTMNRLYVVESGLSITGAAADHRLPLRPSQVPAFVGELAAAIERGDAGAAGSDTSAAAAPHVQKFIQVLAQDLAAHRGRCVVAVGAHQPPAVQAAVHRLNALLGNVGHTVRYTAGPRAQRGSHVEAIRQLAAAMRDGQVQTLLILGGNPVYDAPADVDFAAGLDQVPSTVHVGLYRNETARRCLWHVPQAHFLESWGDARSWDGTYSVVQPMIAPLYGGRTPVEIVARLLGEPLPKSDELVKATLQALAGDQFSEKLWRQCVHDGLWADSAWPAETVPDVSVRDLPADLPAAAAEGSLELVLMRDASVYDGRFANISWLQECPDPMTKLTWDNAAIMSPATARALQVADESRVRLESGGRSVEAPVYVMPGWADGVVGLALGYGRVAAGSVGGLEEAGVAPVGANAYQVRTSQAMYTVADLKVEGLPGRFPLSSTQDHHAIDAVGLQERARRVPTLVREASLDHFLHHPDFVQHVTHEPASLESMWTELPYDGHKWGMAIDLTKCIGCSACVVACQAENNVPVVGKEQIKRGREMHWIRIDRYFQGDAEHPEEIQVAMQPVACQQCELAPCEQVCPVAATVHSSEGLNDMVYNRCIGTRYCANNCPYKVRRFNYFNYHKDLQDPRREVSKMVFNPDVTVRARGVMEKCTYCVQRIQAVKIDTRNAGQPIPDGAIRTACQQACPAQAIVFGDLADAQAQVSRQHGDDRAYRMLGELNVKPRTAYLARIRNPHPDLASASPPAGAGHS